MPSFQLQPDVHRNVAELRRVLGSVTRALSHADLAKLLNERDASRKRSLSTIQRWEREGVEPDLESIRVMAELAGVSFEAFALGTGAVSAPVPTTAEKVRAAAEATGATHGVADQRARLLEKHATPPAKKAGGGKRGGAA